MYSKDQPKLTIIVAVLVACMLVPGLCFTEITDKDKALFKAAKEGCTEDVKRLVSEGADVDSKDACG